MSTVDSFVHVVESGGVTWSELSTKLKRTALKFSFDVGFKHDWLQESPKRQSSSSYFRDLHGEGPENSAKMKEYAY